ncbi:MAG: hypothetical protein MJ131_01085 [Lachnospiraceae bacterium]|nr:hypothetical protein [Lachnospiraceae bacterium]
MKILFVTIFITLFTGGYLIDAKSDDEALIIKAYYPKDYNGYIYKAIPLMNNWPYGNHQEMVDICQIPEDILMCMSTEELFETVLYYPLNIDILFYDDVDFGYEIVKKYFNGLNELIRRDNCNTVGIKYLLHHLECEFDAAQKVIINKLITCPPMLSIINTKSELSMRVDNSYPMMFMQIFTNEDPNGLYSYGEVTVVDTEKGGHMNGEHMGAKELWKYSDNSVRIWARDDYSNDAKAKLNERVQQTYNMNHVTGYGPSSKYNCHSYAWFSQTNCNYWIASFNATGYNLVDLQNVSIGDKAVFYNTYGNSVTSSSTYSHSAVVDTIIHGSATNPTNVTNLYVRSKWGPFGVYRHTLSNCPYFYTNGYPCDILYFH